ncbi:MAG: HD domain-containing protein, partial [Prevotella sp.]|nr:HD domain-containing protein [Prevotella sp.]
MVKFNFTTAEREETLAIYGKLRELIGPSLQPGDEEKMRAHLMNCIEANQVQRDVFGNNPILQGFQTALIVVEEIGLKRDAVLSILLHPSVESGFITIDEVKNQFGEAVARILHGLQRIAELYEKTPVVESENFRDLLLSFAEDMRVILIMIASRVNLMRQIRDTDDDADRRRVSQEAAYLYAPLAHKLGLYKLKSELEDLSLKYLEHDAYYHIREKLNSTKAARDAYIARFIGPIEEKLKAAGLHFHMKGRTKSIHSIWQKMKKQKCGFEGIYDLFAIRIILDSPLEKEKMHCWQVYSIVTDM